MSANLFLCCLRFFRNVIESQSRVDECRQECSEKRKMECNSNCALLLSFPSEQILDMCVKRCSTVNGKMLNLS